MQQAKNLTPPTDPTEPHLKLRKASVDQGDDGSDGLTAQPVSFDGDSVAVAPGTVLPFRCVKCGDAMDTLPIRSIRGDIHYRLCRDHVVSTVACVLAGLALVTLGVTAVGSRLLGDPIVGTKLMLVCVLLAFGGAGLICWALPVLTSARVDGRHRIRRLHPDVVDDLRRMDR